MGDGGVGSGSLDSGCHQLSENIWFVWSKTSYSGDKWRCHQGGTGRDGQLDLVQLCKTQNVSFKKEVGEWSYWDTEQKTP